MRFDLSKLGKSRETIYLETKEWVKEELSKARELYFKVIEETKARKDLDKEQLEEIAVSEYNKYIFKESELIEILEFSWQEVLEDSNR